MQICGLQKTTLLDYPGRVAATIFTFGCNFRCPYCHNMNLVEPENKPEILSREEILSFLRKRAGVLEGVCITGGEPTINPELVEDIREIKELGYCVKLDTNGTNPGMIRELIEEGLIDYAAMDIKTGFSDYERVAGVSRPDIESISQSIELLINGDFPYEFRTTLCRQYHTPQIMEEIGSMIRASKSYYLQSFRDSEYVRQHELGAYDKEELLQIVKQLSKYDITAYIRGVD